MAKNSQTSTTGRNTKADAYGALFNSGKLRVYSGSQPVNADTAIMSQVLLAELTFASTAFSAAASGTITANTFASISMVANGTATWCRAVKADGTTVIEDGSVGVGAGSYNLVVGTTAFDTGAPITSPTYTHTEAASVSGL